MTAANTDGYYARFSLALLHPKHWGTWLAVGVLLLMAFVPIKLRYALAKSLAPTCRHLCKKPVRIGSANLRLCYPEKTPAEIEQMLERMFANFIVIFTGLGTLILRSEKTLLDSVIVEGWENTSKSQQGEKAAVFLVPHLYGIEYAGAALSALGIPMVGMVNSHKNPVFNWLACVQRCRFGASLLHRDAGMSAVVRNLKSGLSLFYLPDQDHGPDKSVFAPFFGTTKATLPVISRMARLGKADILPLTVGFDERSCKMRVQISPPMVLDNLDKAEEARLLNQQMEESISRYPDQYMWFLKILQTRPEGEVAPY